jgi:hypothetical protein
LVCGLAGFASAGSKERGLRSRKRKSRKRRSGRGGATKVTDQVYKYAMIVIVRLSKR